MKSEVFIITESDKEMRCMRMVATDAVIKEQVDTLEETGRYINVIVAKRFNGNSPQ